MSKKETEKNKQEKKKKVSSGYSKKAWSRTNCYTHIHTHTHMSMLREFKEDGVPTSIKQKQGSMEEKRDKKKTLMNEKVQ